MKTARLVALIAITGTAWAVSAKPAPKPAAPSPQQVVAARQAAFSMSAAALAGIEGATKAGAPAKSQGFAARGLAKWAAAMPAMFAPNTRGITPSRAKPEVWTDKAGFAAKAAAYQDATKALAAAAQADDKDAFAAALASTGASCKGCHDTFQVPPPAPAAPPKAG